MFDPMRFVDRRRTASPRDAQVAEIAYFLAEKRGFAPGHEVEDWLAAEAQWDAMAGARTTRESDSR